MDDGDRIAGPEAGAEGTPSREELRFAVVLNGGVSLAIWMGGVVHEIDRLAKGQSAYRSLLEWAGSVARVDVITGTSAGGINGAALALSTTNAKSRGLGELRNTWIESGSLSRMMRQPFHGAPPSLLQGDEFFLVELNRAMKGLTVDYEPVPLEHCPMDLAITCTLLNGVTSVVTDAAGQQVGQVRHDGLFRFQRGPSHRKGPGKQDDFAAETIAHTVDALALASRSTASFPVAFEPSLVPTSAKRDETDPVARLRPDMHDFLSGAWLDQPGAKTARYAVDGGVLANTPTKPALEAIDRMPVRGPVRRVMLLVHPHAGRPGEDVDDTAPPSLLGLGGALATALMSQGSRNYVEEVERHNDLTGGRRRLRADVVMKTDPDALVARAAGIHDWYRAKRHERMARDLATIWVRRRGDGETRPFGDVVGAVTAGMAETGWSPKTTGGFEGALGVTDAATDYLKRRCWGDNDRSVHAARVAMSDLRDHILDQREKFYEGARSQVPSDQPAAGAADAEAPTIAAWLADLKDDYSSGGEGRIFRSWVDSVARTLAELPPRPEQDGPRLQTDRDEEVLRRFHDLVALGPAAKPEADAGGDARVVDIGVRLQALDTVTYVLSNEVTTGASLPVELVQLTFDVKHPFAPGLTGEQKVAGDLVGRFSGFLKRSWRVNDWTWGRLDAIETLCRIVLDPDRVRRRLVTAGADTAARRKLVEGLFAELYPDSRPDGIPTVDDVVQELTALVEPPTEGGSPTRLEALVRVFATRLALDAAGDDLPELPIAVRADIEEGANTRAPGVVGVTSDPDVYTAARTGGTAARWEALRAFGRSGVGRDPLSGEASSDQTIGTVARAAAVTVSVLDSDTSGLGFAKPVTSALRGATLLPYWAVTGLTSSGRLARALALGALAVGGVLLTLGLFGVGPTWGVAVGAGTVLGVFAFSALRSGTVLHGSLLLLPTVGILAWAGYRYQQGQDPGAADTTTGVPVLLAVLGLAAGLALLGALRPPVRSPLAWVSQRPLTARVTAVALVAVVLLWVLLPGLGDSVGDSVTSTGSWVADQFGRLPTVVLVVVLVVVVLAAGWYALWIGTRWRLVVKSKDGSWTEQSVEHPVGVSAGWSWVYGVVTALAAVLVSWLGDTPAVGPAERWAATVALVVTAGLLLWPVPFLMDRRARRLTDDRARAALRTPTEGSDVDRLVAAGLNYRYLVRPDLRGIELTDHAASLAEHTGLTTDGVDDRGPDTGT